MKYLITGGSGQVGYDCLREIISRGKNDDVLIPEHEVLDITNRDCTIAYIKNTKPDVIIHCAAYTNVDAAENDCRAAYDINVNGTQNIKDGAVLVDAKLIYVSTDYVFDGTKDRLYEMTDEAKPINVYGQTKLLGEEIVREYKKHFIVRTSWVFGLHGRGNFVKTMLRLAETHDKLKVVADQIGSPTYSKDLARLLVDMSESDKYGTYPGNNDGYTSWCEFATYIFKVNGKNTQVEGISTKDYNATAPRPLNTRLSKKALDDAGFAHLPHWQDALVRFSEELRTQDKQKNLRKEK